MTTSNGNYLKTFHDQTRALGRKSINSDFSFEIEGFEGVWLLAKQCPFPTLSSAGEIEIPTPLGSTMWEAQQTKVAQQGAVSFLETVAGDIDQTLIAILANRSYFNAKVYEGTPQRYVRYKRFENCFLQLEAVDRDWENRAQPMLFTGTLFYHYYGETVSGNSTDYR